MSVLIDAVKRVVDPNERELAAAWRRVRRINVLEPETEQLSDGELRGKAAHFRHRLSQGETLDDIMPEAFAVVREGAQIGRTHVRTPVP